MSKIGVALALCVILLGAALFIGRSVATDAVARGNSIGKSLENLKVDGTNGAVTFTMP